jgi:hypothetical protein
LFNEKKGIQARVFALGRDFLAPEIGNFIDAGVRAHDHPMIEQADGLA